MKLLWVGLFALSLVISPVAEASVMASWGPASDIVTTSYNMSVGNNSQSVSFGSYTSPAVSATYYPNNTGKAPSFYAAAFRFLQSDSDPAGTTGSALWRITDGTPDQLYCASNGPADTTYTEMHHIYLWKAGDFLSSGALDTMSVDTAHHSGSLATDSRFVIQVGGTDFYTTGAYGVGAQSFSDPTTVAWYDYDPTTDFSDVSGGVATLTSTDFGNITALGVYVENKSGARYVKSYVNSFEATAIPEPATLGIVLLGGLMAFARRMQLLVA